MCCIQLSRPFNLFHLEQSSFEFNDTDFFE